MKGDNPINKLTTEQGNGKGLPMPRLARLDAPGVFHTMTIADDLFVGISEKIKEIRTIIPQVADTNSTVLISGESGTEKPLSRITNIS